MKLFVWDLHGTLEYGNHGAVIDISNEALSQLGYGERFSYEDGRRLCGLRWFEYFAWVLGPDSDERALDLREACFNISESNVELQRRWLRPTPHALDVSRETGVRHDQVLISNTRPTTLMVFVDALDLASFFPEGLPGDRRHRGCRGRFDDASSGLFPELRSEFRRLLLTCPLFRITEP